MRRSAGRRRSVALPRRCRCSTGSDGLALLSLGRPVEARDALEVSLSAAQSRHAAYEVACSTLALATAVDDEAEASRLRTESEEILGRLGVHSVPEAPPGSEGASVRLNAEAT